MLQRIGLAILMIGISLADSENLIFPLLTILVGAFVIIQGTEVDEHDEEK